MEDRHTSITGKASIKIFDSKFSITDHEKKVGNKDVEKNRPISVCALWIRSLDGKGNIYKVIFFSFKYLFDQLNDLFNHIIPFH